MIRIQLFIAMVLVVVACTGRKDVQCEQDSNCDLSGGGLCTLNSVTGNRWCAYPDPQCDSGYRFSDFDVGDGVSGICVSGGGAQDAGIDAPPDARPDSPPVVPGSWAKQIPGPTYESVGAVAVAPDGSVFFAGSFDGTLDLGGGPLTATGTYDAFVAKFTSSGQHVWSVRFGGSSTAGINELAVLSNGELAIGGEYRGSATFGSVTLNAAAQDVFLARLSSTGAVVWALSGGTAGDDSLADMAIDASDNIAACGRINGGGGGPKSGSFFGSGSLSGSADAWIARLPGAGGVASWAMVPNADGSQSTCGVGMASNGDVVFVSNYNGNLNVGGSTFTSVAASLDIFLARFRGMDGAHVWSASQGGTGNESAYDVDVSNSSMVVVGTFTGSASFGGSTLNSINGSADNFVAKFDAGNGTHMLSMAFGNNYTDSARYVSTRSDGLITVAGNFKGTVNFGGTSLTSNGATNYDPYAVDIDGSTGAITSVRTIGGSSNDDVLDVVSTAESVVFGGSFADSMEVLQQTFTSMGTRDGYVIRYKR